MTSEQKIIAWMATLLIALAIWRVYKPYLSLIMFGTPSNTTTISSGLGNAFNYSGGSLPGDALQTVTGGLIGPNGEIYGYGPNANPWAPF